MLKTFVTGGTGFIGSRLVSQLVQRGDQVFALVRSQKGAAALQAMGAHPVWGDINAIESMREGMRGCDLVFHLAAWYKLGSPDWRRARQINVDGTRNVLSLAFELGVPKIVYASTIAVYGDTHGFTPDEGYLPPEGPFLTEYDRTKWQAHFKVALPLIEQGAPVVIVMPGGVYGPGDTSLIAEMMRFFYLGLFPILPAPETTLTYAHVEDIARGHILAAEKGKIGQVYHLAGPAVPLGEMMKLWSRATGKRTPYLSIPARFFTPFIPVVAALNSVVPLPAIVSRDSVSILGATYLARSDKARDALGWRTRPLAEGIPETFAWIAQTTQPLHLTASPAQRRQLAGIALSAAAGLLFAWLLTRKRS